MVNEFVEKNDKLVQRILEIIPGLFTWLFILSPVWLGLLYPPAVAYLLIFLTVYWLYLAIKSTIGSYVGYFKFKKELSIDWMQEVNKLKWNDLPHKETRPDSLEKVLHFVLLPVVDEPNDVLEPALNAILNQTFPTKQIALFFTVEERGGKVVEERIRELVKPYLKDLALFDVFIHPKGIPGEAIGAGAANRTWGAQHAVEVFKKHNLDVKNIIYSNFDCDHVPHDQYLARLTHLYLTADDRNHKFYSPTVYLFDNNLWRAPLTSRIQSTFVTLGTLSDWALTAPGAHGKDTFSAYSSSLQTLIDIDFWDVSLGIDDTIFFWRAFIHYDGNFRGLNHYIPYSADAVEGRNFWHSQKSLYKQLWRWGYGVIDFPLSVKAFITNSKIPFKLKVMWMIRHLKIRLLLVNITFVMTFGFTITTLINPLVKQSIYVYSVPTMMSTLLTFALIFIIPGTLIRMKLNGPMPKNWPLWKRVVILAEGPLMIINLLTFSFVPFVDAQTRMMLGKKMKDLYHTPKVR